MNRKQVSIGVLTGVVLVFICSSLVVEKRLSDTREALRTSLNDQTAELISLATDLGDGKAVELARDKNIVTDCKSDESQEYDTLLSALDRGLSNSQLQSLKNLFNHCGSVPVASRAFVVYVLEQEVDTLEFLVTQQDFLGSQTDSDQQLLADWRELVEKEKEINAQFYALVDVQGKIIDTLQAGEEGDIAPIQSEAQSVQVKYAKAIAEASELRTTLVAP